MSEDKNDTLEGEDMDDSYIIELYLARNEQAIKETDVKYGRLCFRIAENILGNKEDSEECVNDTYWKVWNLIPPTIPNNFMAFISKIVRNISLKKNEFIHAQKRTPNVNVAFEELEYILSDDRIANEFDEQDIASLIDDFLRNEKESVRNVFIRRYYFFDSIKEISERYLFTEVKVKNILYHTRKKLRKYLEKEGVRI